MQRGPGILNMLAPMVCQVGPVLERGIPSLGRYQSESIVCHRRLQASSGCFFEVWMHLASSSVTSLTWRISLFSPPSWVGIYQGVVFLLCSFGSSLWSRLLLNKIGEAAYGVGSLMACPGLARVEIMSNLQ